MNVESQNKTMTVANMHGMLSLCCGAPCFGLDAARIQFDYYKAIIISWDVSVILYFLA